MELVVAPVVSLLRAVRLAGLASGGETPTIVKKLEKEPLPKSVVVKRTSSLKCKNTSKHDAFCDFDPTEAECESFVFTTRESAS